MLEITRAFSVIYLFTFVTCKTQPFIVEGENAQISDFPHSAFFKISCVDMKTGLTIPYVCGSSIINERILLTAAHCVAECSQASDMYVSVGHRDRKKGHQTTVIGYFTHEYYVPTRSAYDIALLKVATKIPFNQLVKRVVILEKPPYFEIAEVSGWGLYDDVNNKTSMSLMSVTQRVWKDDVCRQILSVSKIPKGTLCASSGTGSSYPARGDSGSALMVRGFIQIGIVSFKMPERSKDIIIYTDTGYYYDWIKDYTRSFYCADHDRL